MASSLSVLAGRVFLHCLGKLPLARPISRLMSAHDRNVLRAGCFWTLTQEFAKRRNFTLDHMGSHFRILVELGAWSTLSRRTSDVMKMLLCSF